MTRALHKVLGKTVLLSTNKKQNLLRAIGTLSNNNYSTRVNKENFITIPTLKLDKNRLDTLASTQELNLVEYQSWSKEDVFCLLCAPRENGGAGLTIEKVKPLYDAGFDGTSVDNIVKDILQQKKYSYIVDECWKSFPNISRDTIKSVVYWVDHLLKTRLNQLWAEEEVGQPVRDITTDLLFKSNNPFVDRHNELLHILNHAFERRSIEKPVLVYTISAPGTGKTALLAEWMNQLTIHEKKVVIYRFLNGVGNNDEELCIDWYDKLMRGTLQLNQKEEQKIKFLNSIYVCTKVGDYIGLTLKTDLKVLISKLEKEQISQESPNFGQLALATLLKVGIARKYQGKTIVYDNQRYDIEITGSECDLTSITKLPEFITDIDDPRLLLQIWYELSKQNSTKEELLFKHYGLATKPFLYIAIDEIQELSNSVSKTNGGYYLLSAILSIWDKMYYDVFVLIAGTSINHSFLMNRATEYNYPPTPLVERKYLDEILITKYGKQLYIPDNANIENMLSSELSTALMIGFYKCGGIARNISELLTTFENLIIDGTGSIQLAIDENEQAVMRYFSQGGNYFSNLSITQKAVMIWLTVIPLSLNNYTRLTVPGNNETNKCNPTLENLQQIGIIVPFILSQVHTYYYIPYFMRAQLKEDGIENTFKKLLANKDGAQICDIQYLLIDPHISSKTFTSNDLAKLFEMVTINSIWCMYKYYKQTSTVTVKSLFPEITKLGEYYSEDLFVEWDGMILLNNQFDYKNESTCIIEPNYLYKNGDNAQHGDILFIAKTKDGKQLRVAIECRNLRKENQVSLTNIINRGINILFGRSHLDLKPEMSAQNNAILENIIRQKSKNLPSLLDSHYTLTCDDIIYEEQLDEELWKQRVQQLKHKSAFDVFILLAPNQTEYNTSCLVQKKYDNVLNFWQQTNQFIIFNGRRTIHDHTLKYLKECIPQIE